MCIFIEEFKVEFETFTNIVSPFIFTLGGVFISIYLTPILSSEQLFKTIINEIKKLGYNVKHSLKVDSKICDIYIPSLNLIIEYFGDYWHCNPKKYDSNFFNKKKSKFAWELWDYDKKKIDLIKSYGYNLEVVWEGDLKLNNKLIEIIIQNYVTKFNSTP